MSQKCTPSSSQFLLNHAAEKLKKIFHKIGIIFNLNLDESFTLTQEQSLIIRDLNNYLNDDSENKVCIFLKNLKVLCQKEKYLKKFLFPTILKKPVDNNEDTSIESINLHQDCLFGLFLKIPSLQNDIIELLLENVTDASIEETDDTFWFRTLLKPLRCLPTIKNSHQLTVKLLDILEVSTFICRLELLDALPDILPDKECDIAAKKLIKLLDEDDNLCCAIVDCFNALNLETDIRAEVQDRILMNMSCRPCLKTVPIFLQFLFQDFKSQNALSILHKIRNVLETIMSKNSTTKEDESCKLLIFTHLRTFAMSQKLIAESWLNAISNIKTSSDHKPIDFLIMFMLHHVAESRKRIIEGIFRKRVSMNLFTIVHLQQMFEKYLIQQLLKDYMQSIIEIGCCLMKSTKEQSLAQFASAIFECLFNHEFTGPIYRGEILSSLISLRGYSEISTVNTVLTVIQSLIRLDHRKVQNHLTLLMQLLEKLDTLDLQNIEIVFDILCSLTCGSKAIDDNDSLENYQNEIHILIRKQLSNSERTVKYRGIISAVVMVKYIASVSDENQDHITTQTASEMNINQWLENVTQTNNNRPAKEAASILEMIKNSIGNSPEFLGLYYDQLASIFAIGKQCFDKHFLYWIYNLVTKDFKKTFVTENVSDSNCELNFTMQYSITSDDSEELFCFGIDIARNTICDRTNKILALAPYFRILRLLHLRQHSGNLNNIDCLLSYPVILPEVIQNDDLNDDDSADDELTQTEIQYVVDCLFHCINWFRELISAFVTQQNNEEIQKKVLQRLQHLIDLEGKFYKYLNRVPGHRLPISYFDCLVKMNKQKPSNTETKTSKTNPKKKFKSVSIVVNNDDDNDEDDAEPGCTSASTAQTQNKKSSKTIMGPVQRNVRFREFDIDVILLAKYPLKLKHYQRHPSQEFGTIYLHLNQLKFILKDFVGKLSSESSRETFPKNIIKVILAHINEYFEIIRKVMMKIAENDDALTSEYTIEEINDIKCCFGYILQIFYQIFQWPGFQQQTTSNLDLLRSLLISFRCSDENSCSSISTNRLITDLIKRMASYSEQCLHLNHAVSLIKLLETLQIVMVTTDENIQKKIARTAEYLLKRRWYNFNGDLDSGKNCNQNIDVLLKTYLRKFTVNGIFNFIQEIQDQTVALKLKGDSLIPFEAVNKLNFHVLFVNLFNALLSAIRIEIEALTNKEHLALWLEVATCMNGLKIMLKAQMNRMNLGCYLKKSIAILKIFLSHGIPILEIMLKKKHDEVYNILRSIQDSTRFLHTLCCETKITKNSALVSYIPTFRHILESLLYRVKAILVVNNCSAAFWMGNLKNKKLTGEEILSQSTVMTSTMNDDDNDVDDDDTMCEQLPSDDDNLIVGSDNEIDNMSEEKSRESEVYL